MTQTEVIKAIAEQNGKNQETLYERLLEFGLDRDDVDTIKKMVFFYKLYNDATFYNAAVQSLGGVLYEELRA